MSIIIDNMDMPKNCDECPLLYDDMECSITATSVSFEQQMAGRLSDCPLKPAKQEPKFIVKADGTIEQIKNCDDCSFKIDEIVKEIELENELSNRLHGISAIGLRKALKIIHKHIDKEKQQ